MPDTKEEVEKIDEASINAYMEAVEANGEAPLEKERITYYTQRYNGVKATYKALLLQKEEAQQYRDKEQKDNLISKLTPAFRQNYIERLAVVTELRKLGQVIDDPYVPLSKI